MPPPEPRSSTRSPARNSATASGLPQPRLAVTASAGSSLCSAAEYSPDPKAAWLVAPPAHETSVVPPQQDTSAADAPQHPSASALDWASLAVTAMAAAA